MAGLFVIGNGFDISHGLETSYQKFHEYLMKKYPSASPDDAVLPPQPIGMPDGSEKYDLDEAVSIIMKVINDVVGDNWSDLETSLGYLEYDDFLESLDDDPDANEWHTVYDNEDNAYNLAGAILMVTKLFDDWVRTINVNAANAKNDLKKLINNNQDFFITFNYTPTLEQIYGVKNVCHIHGQQGENLYFGHGNQEDYYDDNMAKYVGAENELSRLQESLRKNTKEALQNNEGFFRSLRSIDKIYSYGFSFADVDLFYIEELCRRIDTKGVTWMLNDFDDVNKQREYMDKIRKCGFLGSFDTYHIS